MEKMLAVALIVVILVAVLGAGTVGYVLGDKRGTASNSLMQIDTLSNVSAPIPDPFSFTFVFQGNRSSVFVPMVYLAPGYSSEVYVRYGCPYCESQGAARNFSILMLNISSYLPLIFSI